jgi:hypothetical protein
MARAAQRKEGAAEDRGAAPPRTAVLVFHGMGDQRPMETMLGVVDAVLGEAPKDEDGAKPKGSIPRWIKPYVGDDGSFDLKSVTTPGIGETEKRRYDFFELYWAHLVTGVRPLALVLWFCDLAKRDRKSLPSDTRWVWFAVVTLITLSLFAVVHVGWVVAAGLIGLNTLNLAAILSVAGPVLTCIFAGIAAVFLLSPALGTGSHATGGVPGATVFAAFAGLAAFNPVALLTVIPVAIVLVLFLSRAMVPGVAGSAMVALLGAHVGPFFAWLGFGEAVAPSSSRYLDIALLTLTAPEGTTLSLLVLLAVLVFLGWAFLVPYLGDCACYLRDAPDNIAARTAIRNLGMKVLRDLHARKNPDGTLRYDRVVVVAHSLGSIIAYDVLRAFFVDQLPDMVLSDEAVAACRELESMARAGVAKGTYEVVEVGGGLAWNPLPGDPAPGAFAYQQAVRRAFGLLAGAGGTPGASASPWRVSDFVTMGSPLALAQFLLTQFGKDPELKEKVTLREFPVAPPALSPGEPERILFAPNGGAPDRPTSRPRLQHSALFAVTCWTNLYFVQRFALRGDFFAGPIPERYSPGTLNVPMHTSLFGGYINHIHYWKPEPEQGGKTPHIRALKLAVLGEDACRELNHERRKLAGSDDLAM